MRTLLNGESENKILGRGEGRQETILDPNGYNATRALCGARGANNRRQLEFFGHGGTSSPRVILSQPGLNYAGGGLRRLLGASERRLAGIVEQKNLLISQRDNLLAQIELLDRLEQEERQNLEETREVFSNWEDSVAASLPITQDANITT